MKYDQSQLSRPLAPSQTSVKWLHHTKEIVMIFLSKKRGIKNLLSQHGHSKVVKSTKVSLNFLDKIDRITFKFAIASQDITNAMEHEKISSQKKA